MDSDLGLLGTEFTIRVVSYKQYFSGRGNAIISEEIGGHEAEGVHQVETEGRRTNIFMTME
jgi:hypothetical protein